MGRWVTSKGRRIYIPDEGEENPYAKKDNIKSYKIKNEVQAARSAEDMLGTGHGKVDIYEVGHNTYNLKHKDTGALVGTVEMSPTSRQGVLRLDHSAIKNANKDEETKQKQITTNKAQADERNGKKYKPLTKEENEVAKKYIQENKWVHDEVNRQLKAGEDWDKVMRQVYGVAEKYGKKDTLQKASEAIVSKEATEGLKKLKKRKGSKK